MVTALIFIVVLSILVFAHELGHFWTARKLGAKAEEFGFGFPPRAIGFYKDVNGRWRKLKGSKAIEELPAGEEPADTVYSINWLPVGGFVRIKGENGEGKQDPDSFASKSLGKRAIILSAGVIMNIILAAILLSVGFMIGMPQPLEDAGPSARITKAEVVIIDVIPGSPAENVGLKQGDIIAKVGENSVDSHSRLQELVAERGGQETEFLIIRGEEQMQEAITPVTMESTGKPGIGVSVYASGTVRYPFFTAIWQGIRTTVLMFWAIIVAFWGLIRGLFMGMGADGQVAGPVGIATLTGQVASLGFAYLLQFMALLSLNLALINILPFPALDGGRLFFLLIERFIGRPVRQSVEALIHTIGFWLLILLIIFVTYKDIVRLF